jgi:hypothetical protein
VDAKEDTPKAVVWILEDGKSNKLQQIKEWKHKTKVARNKTWLGFQLNMMVVVLLLLRCAGC